MVQHWLITLGGETLAYSWFCVGLLLAQRRVMVGRMLGGGLGWHLMLGDGWHTAGFWLTQFWFMVGTILLYGWRLTLDQRVSNEQSNVGPTKYVAVGPTLNQRLGFGWRMVSVLAGYGRMFGQYGRKKASLYVLNLCMFHANLWGVL